MILIKLLIITLLNILHSAKYVINERLIIVICLLCLFGALFQYYLVLSHTYVCLTFHCCPADCYQRTYDQIDLHAAFCRPSCTVGNKIILYIHLKIYLQETGE